MSNELTVSLACVGAVTGVSALVISFAQYLLSRQQRRDELFDRRYEFYQRLRSIWLRTGQGAEQDQTPSLDAIDLIPFAEEADFLFGRDISKHIMSLEDKEHTGVPFFPNSDFIRPFEKYLCLDRSWWSWIDGWTRQS